MNIFILLGLVAIAIALPLRETSFDLIEENDTDKIKFYLYTKSNPNTPQELFIGSLQSVKNSYFEKTRHTKIVIHGWGGSYTTSPNKALRDAYLLKDDYNIISIDWYQYAKLNYLSARAKVPVVGENIAEFVDFLNEKFGLDFEKLVIIGHSLGAHVAGFTGKHVKRGKITAIVGLDPAYPLYSFSESSTRLADSDAKFVQSIQTNGNVKGFLKPIGSAAFYPNWGRSQPGCGSDIGGSCAHNRSVTYFAEGVRGYSYAPIFECKSFDNIRDKNGCNTTVAHTELGDPLEIRRVNGIFYFETNDKPPFGNFRGR